MQINYLENKFNTLYTGLDEVEVVATIISNKKETSYKSSYTIKVESINKNRKYFGNNLIIYAEKDANLNYGDKIIINGTFEFASNARNYKAFDYREFLKTKNIYGILNVDKIKVLNNNNLSFISIWSNQIREKIKYNLKIILDNKSDIVIGILLRRYF